jgi:hypothetical protein
MAIIVTVGFLVVLPGVPGQVMAATWTTGGGTFTRAQINANIADGDDITVDVNTIFNIDDATDTDKIIGITVNNGISLTVNFTGSGKIILGNTSNASITITGTGTMTVTGTGGGYFDFSGEANKILTIIGAITGTDAGNKFNMGNNTLKTMTTAVTLNDVIIGGANAKIDADIGTSIDSLIIANAGDDLEIDIADGVTVTIDDMLDVPAASIVTVTSVDGGGTETLAVTNGIRLNGNNAELTIGGDDTNATAVTGDVIVNSDTGIVDVNNNTNITNITMNIGQGDLNLQIANTKVLTTTVYTNDNTLILNETGTLSTLNLIAGPGVVDVNEDCTITSCTLLSNGTIDVLGGKTLTVSNGVQINDEILTLSNSGTISRVDLNQAGGTLKMAVNAATITSLMHTAAGTIDLDNNGCTLTLTNELDVGAQKLTLAGSGGGVAETLAATVDLNNAASELEVTGVAADNIRITTLKFGATGATLDVAASCSPVIITVLGDPTIEVASGQTLTGALNIGVRTLTLSGEGTINTLTVANGRVTANGSTTITRLTASPGVSGTFTYSGTGSSTVDTLVAFNTSAETFIKDGTGTLTVTNGFSFDGATGTKLNILNGTFVDASGDTITFGEDSEEITVANGATFTTSGDIISSQSGTNVNLDAATGSTVNFAKAGTLTLTSAADDDFKMLGTVNVLDGCTTQLAGAFQTQWGSVNVKNTGALVNTVPSSTMKFAQGSTLTLEGSGSGMLNINGQATTTRIVVDTTTGSGTFTIDRGSSNSMTFQNVDLSNCTYMSTAGGAADTELTLTGVLDTANNTNWFSALAASAGSDKTISSGASTTLDGSASGGTGTYTYSWTPTTGVSDATVASPTVSVTETTTYTLTVSDGVDTATDTVTVTVTTAPSPTPTPSPTTGGFVPFCGVSAVTMLPLMLVGLIGLKWTLRRRRTMLW